jgi:hypothetical protein
MTTIVIDTLLDDGAHYAVASLDEALTLVEGLTSPPGETNHTAQHR